VKGKGRAGKGEEGERGASGVSGEPRQGPERGLVEWAGLGGGRRRAERPGVQWTRGVAEGVFRLVALPRPGSSNLRRSRKALTNRGGPSQARRCVPCHSRDCTVS
jgi:hypothetical protein